VAQVLVRHLDWLAEEPPWSADVDPVNSESARRGVPVRVVGLHADLCPECGEAALVTTQGCGTCIVCGHSVC